MLARNPDGRRAVAFLCSPEPPRRISEPVCGREMKNTLLVLFALACLVGATGCPPPQNPIEKRALEYSSDGEIDCDEYRKLSELITKSDPEYSRQFLDSAGAVDTKKLTPWLIKTTKLAETQVCDPDRKFALKALVECSASMDGYLRGPTEFESALFSFLGAINSNDLSDKITAGYINNKIHDFPRNSNEDTTDWLRRYIGDLEPEQLSRCGDRTSSDLRGVIKMAMAEAGGDGVSVLVSDFILSFGKTQNTADALMRERVSITNDVREHLKSNPDFGVLVLQLESRFSGRYFDYQDNVIPFDRIQRPYYIWVMGSARHLRKIIDSGAIEGIKGGVKNQAIFTSTEKAPPIPYRILAQPKVGEFELPDGARGPIVGVKPGRDEKKNFVFSFAIAADFSKQLQDLSVFDELATYKLNDENYSVKVERIKSDAKSLEGFTHRLIFTTSKFKHGELKVEFHSLFPEWIARFSNDSDADIVTNDEAKTQTFGLSDMLGSLQDAFYSNNKTAFNSLTIKIQK